MFIASCQGNPVAKVSSPLPPSPQPTGTSISSPTAEISPTLQPASGPLPTVSAQRNAPSLAAETADALAAAEHVPIDYYRLAVELQAINPASLTPTAPPGPLKVDDRAQFYINSNLNGDYRAIPARLRYLSAHAAWWTSVTAQASDSDIQAAAGRFEDQVLRINQLIFGKEWSPGIDDDPLIHILLVREPQWGGFFGYFSTSNEYPASLYPYSNQREMFVVNLGGVRMDSSSFAGELAHEYQHLIHWSRDPNEDLWLNEAMGELATFLAGAPEASSAIGKTNAELFAEHPEIQLTSRPERTAGDNYDAVFAHYGAERLFAIYLFEQFGAQFIKDLVNNPDPGVQSIQEELDRLPNPPRFSDVYASWLLANLINQPGLMQGQFGYQNVAPVPPVWDEIRSFRGDSITDRLPPYGARYYKVESDQPVKVFFKGAPLAPLTPVDPPSGQFAWYSNRGDESEFSLTRTFDLSALKTATLKYKVWYELEEFYDFGYVEVSTDSGKTWTAFKTSHGTDQDPQDISYGTAYTGSSLKWLDESIDLSPYAGQVIQLRFEVVNDFTTNRDGVQLDDIEIPELGYFDGAEDDSGGWESHGFIRSANIVPVNWITWVVKSSDPLQISWIDVQPDQTAEFEIDGLGEAVPFAALVISPTAPVTTMELDYELIFQYP
ncbi:MAG TPA: hypothetical protein VE136_11770 [Anaerolineales bacterium]|nr:hypothetical protein [Anaerolineales bacterium]